MKDTNSANKTPMISKTFAASSQRILTVDVEKYQAYLDDMDISEAKKIEIIESLFFIMLAFADLGVSVHPLQEVCGKEGNGPNKVSKPAVDDVRSKEPKQLARRRKPSPSGGLEAE